MKNLNFVLIMSGLLASLPAFADYTCSATNITTAGQYVVSAPKTLQLQDSQFSSDGQVEFADAEVTLAVGAGKPAGYGITLYAPTPNSPKDPVAYNCSEFALPAFFSIQSTQYPYAASVSCTLVK
jgi:hypothetical protein